MNRLVRLVLVFVFGVPAIMASADATSPQIYEADRSIVEFEYERTKLEMARIAVRLDEINDQILRAEWLNADAPRNDQLRLLRAIADKYDRKMREHYERQNARMAQLEVKLFSGLADVHLEQSGSDGASTILRAVRYKGAIQLGGRTFVTLEGPEGRWQVEISTITAIEQKAESTTQPSSK